MVTGLDYSVTALCPFFVDMSPPWAYSVTDISHVREHTKLVHDSLISLNLKSPWKVVTELLHLTTSSMMIRVFVYFASEAERDLYASTYTLR